jgi:hypothetical protein
MLDIANGVDEGLAFVFGPDNTLQGTDSTLMEAKIGKQSRLVRAAPPTLPIVRINHFLSLIRLNTSPCARKESPG